MSLATVRKSSRPAVPALGASLCVRGASPEDLYGAVLDVRSFSLWAPGVRRVEVLAGPLGGAGMVSGWEVSVLGLRRWVVSELREAEPWKLLRWTYDDGPILGWGECEVRPVSGGALADFRTELRPVDPLLGRLMRAPAARATATTHLKGALKGLGRLVAGGDADVLVGPLTAP